MNSAIDRRRRRWLLAGAAGGLGSVASAWAHEGHGATAKPAAALAAAPLRRRRRQLGSGAAIAPDGTLWVVSTDDAGRLQLQHGGRDGARWSAPRRLDHGQDAVLADGEDHPKLAFGPDGQVVVAYAMPLAEPQASFIRLLRSTDGGRRFEAPRTIHQDRQPLTHDLASIAFDARGTLHTVWIDNRDLAAAQREGRPWRGASVWRNASRDAGASFGPDAPLAQHSCECCRLALAPTGDGGVAVLWRHVFDGNVRDHAFARLGGTPAPARPQRATFDGWVVDGCPHQGPGLAAAADGGFHAVWFGQRDGLARVRHGRLDAQGAPVGEVRPLPDAGAEYASVASQGRHVAIVWRSFDGSRTRVGSWVSGDDGASFEANAPLQTAGESDRPRIVAGAPGLTLVWRTAEEGLRAVRLAGAAS